LKLLITGATGFIGNFLVKELLDKNFNVSAVLRSKNKNLPNNVKQFVVGDFDNNTDFSSCLKNIDCVIHLAGKAHVIDKNKSSVLKEFIKINTDLTINLAKQAENAGVSRFIFLSSIRVNGNQNVNPFLESDTPDPQEPYAFSKYEAEQGLFKIAKNTSLEVVIIRPPLVYGANAPGNFGRLINWAKLKKPFPLPLGAIHNKRSLVAMDNLINFIIHTTTHKKAVNEIFLISDGLDVSTTQLLRKIIVAFNKKTFLLPIPANLMIFFLKLIGRKADAVRLFSSLQIDSSKARNLLDWKPVTTMDKQLDKIAKENGYKS
jgi:nucleoside-diphosphate-sugar epimerase